MKSTIYGVAGLLTGLLGMYFFYDPTQVAAPEIKCVESKPQAAQVQAQAYDNFVMVPTTKTIQNIETQTSAPVTQEMPPQRPATSASKKDESAEITKVLSDLQTISYTSTIHEIETNKEWQQLSPEGQEKVMLEVVRRVNSGEIPKSFIFPGLATTSR